MLGSKLTHISKKGTGGKVCFCGICRDTTVNKFHTIFSPTRLYKNYLNRVSMHTIDKTLQAPHQPVNQSPQPVQLKWMGISTVSTMTSQWARWRLTSPASRLFIQPFVEGADQSKCQRSASLAFVRGIHRWPMNSPHKGPVTRKMFPFDGVSMVLVSAVLLR